MMRATTAIHSRRVGQGMLFLHPFSSLNCSHSLQSQRVKGSHFLSIMPPPPFTNSSHDFLLTFTPKEGADLCASCRRGTRDCG